MLSVCHNHEPSRYSPTPSLRSPSCSGSSYTQGVAATWPAENGDRDELTNPVPPSCTCESKNHNPINAKIWPNFQASTIAKSAELSSPSSTHKTQQHKVPVQIVLKIDSIFFEDDLLTIFERRTQSNSPTSLLDINRRLSPTTQSFISRLIKFPIPTSSISQRPANSQNISYSQECH